MGSKRDGYGLPGVETKESAMLLAGEFSNLMFCDIFDQGSMYDMGSGYCCGGGNRPGKMRKFESCQGMCRLRGP